MQSTCPALYPGRKRDDSRRRAGTFRSSPLVNAPQSIRRSILSTNGGNRSGDCGPGGVYRLGPESPRFLSVPSPLTPTASVNSICPAWEHAGELNLMLVYRVTRTKKLGKSELLLACSKPSKSRGTQSSKLEFFWFGMFSAIRARFSKVGRDHTPTIALSTRAIRDMITAGRPLRFRRPRT